MPLTRRRRHSHARRHPRPAAGRLRQGVDQFGRRRTIPSLCARRPGGSAASASWSISTPSGSRRTAARCGKSTSTAAGAATGLEAVAWAREVERLGAGEIVLTSMDADGTKNGYDLEITARGERGGERFRSWPAAGPASPSTWPTRLPMGKADAALAASIFHFGEYTIQRNETSDARAGHSRAEAARATQPSDDDGHYASSRDSDRTTQDEPSADSHDGHHCRSRDVETVSSTATQELEVDKLFPRLVKLEGSDLHLKVGKPPHRARQGHAAADEPRPDRRRRDGAAAACR